MVHGRDRGSHGGAIWDKILLWAAAAAAIGMPFSARAENALSMNTLFSDHAVLQANKPIPVWGRATPGSRIMVAIAASRAEGRAGADGRWTVILPPTPPINAGQRLIATSDKDGVVAAEDVMVGEVWIAAGQSNMEWALENSIEGYAPALNDSLPSMRIFNVQRRQTLEPEDEVRGRWVVVAPRQIGGTSAIGYFFGRRLLGAVGRPVGMLQITYGGTRVEAWTPRDLILTPPYPAAARDVYQARFAQEVETRRAARDALVAWAKRPPADAALPSAIVPSWPAEASDYNIATVIWNGMLKPAAPYAVAGLLWYQGESNHRDGYGYRPKLEAFFEAVKREWGAVPIALVQTAPFVLGDAETPAMWQAQQDVARARSSGFVTVSDVSDSQTIHPLRKQVAGERLANWAIEQVYRLRAAPWSGPRPQSVSRAANGSVVIAFDHAKGLRGSGGAMKAFDWIGPDGVPRPADARVAGNTVVVTAPGINAATEVRFAWQADAQPGLVNDDGIPASTFRLPIP